MRKNKLVAIAVLTVLTLTACGKSTAEVSQTEVTPQAVETASQVGANALPADIAEPDIEAEEQAKKNAANEASSDEAVVVEKDYTAEDVYKAFSPDGFTMFGSDDSSSVKFGICANTGMYVMEMTKVSDDPTITNESGLCILDGKIYYYLGANGTHYVEGYTTGDDSSSMDITETMENPLFNSVNDITSVTIKENKDYEGNNYDIVDATFNSPKEGEENTSETVTLYFNTKTGVVDYIEGVSYYEGISAESSGMDINIMKVEHEALEEPLWTKTAVEDDAENAFGAIFAAMFLPLVDEPITEESIAEGLGDMGIVGDLMTNGVSATFSSDATEGN